MKLTLTIPRKVHTFDFACRAGTFALAISLFLLSGQALLSAFYRRRPALTTPYVTAEMLLFDFGYVVSLGTILVVYLAWKRSRTDTIVPRRRLASIALLFVGNFLILSFLSELEVNPSSTNHVLLLSAFITGSSGFLVLLAGPRTPSKLPFLLASGLVLLVIATGAYSGELHLQAYYGTGLQRPIAALLGFIGTSLFLISLVKLKRR
jgi:hypothetical protein